MVHHFKEGDYATFKREMIKTAEITINTEKCDNCGDCSDVCPMEVLILEDGKLTVNDPDECSYCENCVDICPNECIAIE